MTTSDKTLLIKTKLRKAFQMSLDVSDDYSMCIQQAFDTTVEKLVKKLIVKSCLGLYFRINLEDSDEIERVQIQKPEDTPTPCQRNETRYST